MWTRGYTGEKAEAAAAEHGIRLEVVKLPDAIAAWRSDCEAAGGGATGGRGFVLLPRRWVAERSFAWMARFRRLARDYERLPETLAGLHVVAFVMLMLRQATNLAAVPN